MHNPNQSYRLDVDGLRGIAVSLPLTYHLKFPFVHGGFVGVDLFFVISGFLIFGIIQKQLVGGNFSLVDFYARRIRRLFPALLVVLAATFVAGYFILFAGAFKQLGISVAAATFWFSNHLFLETIDYFNADGFNEPLLHTWSLAIEEQFYIVGPLLLVCIWRFKLKLKVCLLILFLVSLTYSEWLVRTWPQAAFYVLPARAWELLLGALIALGSLPLIRQAWLREVLGVGGLVLIAVPALTYYDGMRFPGLHAVLPCLGAALLIHVGSSGRSFVSRLLSLKPVVFMGLISYSLYLWHWPVLVYYKILVAGSPDRTEKIGLALVCILLGYLSWKFIEMPVRESRVLGRSKTLVFASAASAMALMIGLGMAVMMSDGYANRFPPEVSRIAAYADGEHETALRTGHCFVLPPGEYLETFDYETCTRLSSEKPNVLILGDSHAAHLWYGMERIYPEANFLQITAGGCPPVRDSLKRGQCADLMKFAFDDFVVRHRLDAIIVASTWPNDYLEQFGPTLAYLTSKADHVYVVGPIVEYRRRLPRLIAASILEADPGLIALWRKAETPALDRELARQTAAFQNLSYVSAYDSICPAGKCMTQLPGGQPVQWDFGHLTEEGSVWLAKYWKDRGVFRWGERRGTPLTIFKATPYAEGGQLGAPVARFLRGENVDSGFLNGGKD